MTIHFIPRKRGYIVRKNGRLAGRIVGRKFVPAKGQEDKAVVRAAEDFAARNSL